MTREISFEQRIHGALFGMFIGDALAMPAHWYYNTRALRMDYGEVDRFLQPKNPHPDSILWRSSYSPPNDRADILHDHAQYWGKKDIHYHQFLKAGENTLNLCLARELLDYLQKEGSYSAGEWLVRMIDFMTTPGNHNDTYAEEYLRFFFTAYAAGVEPLKCGRPDETHIGGYSLMLPLLIALAKTPANALKISLEHLALTHGGSKMKIWGESIGQILLQVLHNQPLRNAIADCAGQIGVPIDVDEFEAFLDFPDTTVVGKHYSSACYVEYAVPATLYLAYKYADSPQKGLIANTMCGGDNAGRGAVLGALLGAANGIGQWPKQWVEKLVTPPAVVLLDIA